MRDKAIEPFKVWPTFIDRGAYTRAIVATSLEELRKGFEDHFTQQQTLKKIGKKHPPVLAAIWYFSRDGGVAAESRKTRVRWLPRRLRRRFSRASFLASLLTLPVVADDLADALLKSTMLS